MPRELELYIVQHAKTGEDPYKNLMKASKIIGQVNPEGDTIIVFPELWLTSNPIDKDNVEKALAPLSFLAIEKSIWIIPGAFYVRDESIVKSRSYVLTPKGDIKLFAEKIFPSHPVLERKTISPGEYLDTVDTGKTVFGVIICVDAMYPEISRKLALMGAEIIFNPASIPENRIDLWRSIARTRAAENTVYWASVILSGTRYPDGRLVSGGSIVVNPAGEIIYESGFKEEVARLVIDLDLIEEQRSRWPYINDIKTKKWNEFYKGFP